MTDKAEKLRELFGLASPTILRYVAWLAVVVITISAVAISVRANCWLPLTRSGAAIVVVALLFALIDFTGWARRVLEFSSPSFEGQHESAVWKSIRREIIDDLRKYGVTKTEEEIAFLTERELKSYVTNFPTRFGSAAKGMHVGHEIAMAAYGTLLSGFGDVIGGWFVTYTC